MAGAKVLSNLKSGTMAVPCGKLGLRKFLFLTAFHSVSRNVKAVRFMAVVPAFEKAVTFQAVNIRWQLTQVVADLAPPRSYAARKSKFGLDAQFTWSKNTNSAE